MMKKLQTGLLAGIAAASVCGAEMNVMWGSNNSTSGTMPEKEKFFRNSKYAMFIHWGLFSRAAGNWPGREKLYGISEWLMQQRAIPASEYAELAKKFNPVDFDAEAIAELAKQSGMRYLVITAKHHDGFAMFDSVHPFNIVKASPYGRDPMKELAEACAKRGIGFGFYYSQYQDWHEINGWEKDRKQPEFSEYFEKKCIPQVKELLTNYGPLCMVWFDTPGQMSKADSMRLVELVRKYQPGAMINSRIGNGVGEYSTLGDQEIPRTRRDGLWESIDTTNDSWGYSANDNNWISSREIAGRLIAVVARGGNYMLNIGPDSSGKLPGKLAMRLLTVGDWLKRHGEAIYGVSSSVWRGRQSWGDCTRKGNKAYLFINNWIPGGEIKFYGFPAEIESIVWRGNEKEKLEFIVSDGWTTVKLPMKSGGEKLMEVLEITSPETIGEAVGITGIDPQLTTVLEPEYASLAGVRIKRHEWMERFGEWKAQTSMSDWKTGGKAKWKVAVAEPGSYRIKVRYQGVKNNRVWTLSNSEGKMIEMWARDVQPAPGKQRRWTEFSAGVLDFDKAGEAEITLAVQGECYDGGMDIAGISVERCE